MAIWANEGKDVLVSYNYMLRVEGIYDLPCKAVHSFTKENEFEQLQEGGLNDYVHLLRKPISKPFTFTVERYVGTDPYPPLPLGAELILPVILMVSPFPDRFDISKRTFVFTGCTVMSKTFGELNAEKSGILTETIVIGYREMMEVTIPVHIGKDGSLWAFDGKKVEGKGKRSAETYERATEDERPDQRYWRMNKAKGDNTEVSNPSLTGQKRTQKESAKTEEDTISAVRQWISEKDGVYTNIGTQSAWKRTVAMPEEEGDGKTDTAGTRQWISEKDGVYTNVGTKSAQSREDFYKVETEKGEDGTAAEVAAAAGAAGVRQWISEKDGVYTNIGTKSAQTRADFYQATTEESEEAADAATGVAGVAASVRKWKMAKGSAAGSGTRSAKTETDTDAVARQWISEKGGVYKNIGNQSAQNREDFYQAETEAGEENAGSEAAGERKWKMTQGSAEGSGTRSAKTEKDTEPTARQWLAEEDGVYKNVGKQSARDREDFYKTATEGTEEAGTRQWIAEEKGVYRNVGTKSAQTREDFYKTTAKDIEENQDGAAGARQWKMTKGSAAGSGTQSAKLLEDTDPEARQWKISETVEGTGKRSAKTQEDTEAAIRQWLTGTEEKRVDTPSAKKRSGEKAADGKGRKWPAVSSAKKRSEESKAAPKARKWPKEASAKTETMKEVKARAWEKPGDNKLGGGTASAAQGPDTKAEGRKWPEQSSAVKRQ